MMPAEEGRRNTKVQWKIVGSIVVSYTRKKRKKGWGGGEKERKRYREPF